VCTATERGRRRSRCRFSRDGRLFADLTRAAWRSPAVARCGNRGRVSPSRQTAGRQRPARVPIAWRTAMARQPAPPARAEIGTDSPTTVRSPFPALRSRGPSNSAAIPSGSPAPHTATLAGRLLRRRARLMHGLASRVGHALSHPRLRSVGIPPRSHQQSCATSGLSPAMANNVASWGVFRPRRARGTSQNSLFSPPTSRDESA
jgi:hypothetical protein